MSTSIGTSRLQLSTERGRPFHGPLPESPRLTRQRAFWLGLTGSAGFLAIFLVFFVDTSTIGDVLRNANYAYVAPSLFFYFIALFLRAQRWRFLLRPIIGESRRPIFPVVVVGYMANNLIPVRIGEVVRSYYLSLRENISTAGAFGTVAVERASDVVALLFFYRAGVDIGPCVRGVWRGGGQRARGRNNVGRRRTVAFPAGRGRRGVGIGHVEGKSAGVGIPDLGAITVQSPRYGSWTGRALAARAHSCFVAPGLCFICSCFHCRYG